MTPEHRTELIRVLFADGFGSEEMKEVADHLRAVIAEERFECLRAAETASVQSKMPRGENRVKWWIEGSEAAFEAASRAIRARGE